MADRASNGRPAALFIAPIMPSSRGNGLAMRTGFLLDAYAKRFAIDLVVVPVAGGTNEPTPFVSARVRRAIVLPATVPDTHFTLVGRVADPKARLAAFRQYGRPSITARLSAELERALLAFAGNTSYQLMHVSRLYLASLATPWMNGGGPTYRVLDCDEDDVNVCRRFALLHRKWGRDRRADWEEAEADAFKALASRYLPRFDLLLAASTGEARLLQPRAGKVDIAVIPNVAPLGAFKSVRLSQARQGRRDILFVGNMGYLPNIDAAMWFATRVWPTLHSTVPVPLRFVIAGLGATREVRNLARRPDIFFAGGFDDAAPLYHRAALAVVPIRAGGGTRIKLLEAATHGVPVVATRFGAEGSGFRSGRELLLADTEHAFATSCARLLTDFRLASLLVAGASRKVYRDHDAGQSADRLLDRIDARFAAGMR